jgi:signal transduction histidine kinase
MLRRFSTSRRPRRQLTALLLTLTLFVCGALAWEAYQSARLQPVFAERVVALTALVAGLVIVALRQLRRRDERERRRTEFISSVSEQLKTPLAQVRSVAETLLVGRAWSEEHRRAIEMIDQEARRMSHLVENVLVFSRSEGQGNSIVLEPTVLAPFVRDTLEAFARLAQSKRVAVAVSLDEEAVAPVDRGALRQMLLNLLDNAVKYGPAGESVTVSVERRRAAVRVSVADEGSGIPPRDRERIWTPFCRLERERHSGVAGTGIGLAVVRELCERHGGRAWVEDAPGGGARFVLELPATVAADRTPGEAVVGRPNAAATLAHAAPAQRSYQMAPPV